jgi:hypothetical protein
MSANSTAGFVGALLNLIDDFVSELRSKMIAAQLIRIAATAAAKYRAAQRTRDGTRTTSKMCLVLEEDDSSASLERVERKRISRRLEPVRQALFVADDIVEKTFSPRRNLHRLSAYATVPSAPAKSSRL